jgi:antitoxin ParD1/3/4
MSIQLPADLETSIRQKVERGDFPDASEVIREAMRLLDQHERQIARLRDMLQTGLDQLDQGEGVPFTPDLVTQMRQDAEERFLRGEHINPDVGACFS